MRLSHLKERRYQELYGRFALGVLGIALRFIVCLYLLFTAHYIVGLALGASFLFEGQCTLYFNRRLKESRAVNQDRTP